VNPRKLRARRELNEHDFSVHYHKVLTYYRYFFFKNLKD
jgi:hypothetical protein